MAWPQKLITAATKTRNKQGPRSDRLILFYACCETSGPVLYNDGLKDIYNSRFAGFGNGIIQGTPVFHNGSGDEEPYIELGGAGAAYVDLMTASGADIEVPRGTLLLRFKSLAALDEMAPSIFHTGSPTTTAGTFRVTRGKLSAGSPLLVFLRWGSDPDKITLTFNDVNWDVPHTVVVTWGERGLKVWLDDAETTQEDLTVTDGWKILNTKTLYLANNDVGEKMDSELMTCAMWDVQLENVEIEELLDDPYLPGRPTPNKDTVFSTNAGPACGRPTRTSATLTCTTGHGSALISADVGWRVKYGTDRTNLPLTAGPVSVTGTDKIKKTLDLVLSGLTAGTRYFYRAEYTTDGSTFHPFPVGTGSFRTQPSESDSFSFIVLADDHQGGLLDGGMPDPEIEGFGVELWEYTSHKRFAGWRALQDICVNQTPDFILHLGDGYIVDADKSAGKSDIDAWKCRRVAIWRNFWARMLKQAAFFFTLGNHEAECGYQQSADKGNDAAMQKQATIARKRFIPNPTNETYPEGGENEGDPNIDGGLDWLPGDVPPFSTHQGGYRGYLTDYVIDGLGENASPLQNYWAMTWGDLLLVSLDVHRYTEPGDPTEAIGTGGARARPGPTWILGEKQEAWLRKVLSNSTATWKAVAMHHLTGGEHLHARDKSPNNYGRGSAINLGSAEELKLHRLFQQTGVNFVFKGHDHKFCHVTKDGVEYVSVPTLSASTLADPVSAGAGWHGITMADSYGTAESEGADLATKGGGSGTLAGIRKMLNVLGYLQVDVTPTSLTVKLRRTETARAQDAGDQTMTETLVHLERYIGPAYQPAADVVDVSDVTPRPRDVAYAALNAELTGDWWDAPPADRKGAPVGDYGYDEDYGDSSVALSGTGDVSTRVAVVPAELYSFTLQQKVLRGANPYVRSISLKQNDWQRATDLPIVVDATVSVPSGNSGDTVEMRIDGGSSKHWPRDSRLPFRSIDLSRIEFRGTSGDRVLIVGNTR